MYLPSGTASGTPLSAAIAITEQCGYSANSVFLRLALPRIAEHVRVELMRTPHVGDPARELRQVVHSRHTASITQTSDGEYLAMDPNRAQALVSALRTQVEHAVARGSRPVLLCSARVRRHLRRLIEQAIPHLAVCSYNEIAPGISVETIGVIEHELEAA